MKNKLRRLPKWLRLALLLALSGLLVFCMWLEARRPALSPQGALRQAEQVGLLIADSQSAGCGTHYKRALHLI